MIRWGKKDVDAEGEATGMSDEMDLCPVCGSLVGEEHAGYERKGDLRVTRVVKCPKCHTKWKEEYVPANRTILRYGACDGQEGGERELLMDVVQDLVKWARHDAFVRGDECPRLSCDEINESVLGFAQRLLASDMARRPEGEAQPILEQG